MTTAAQGVSTNRIKRSNNFKCWIHISYFLVSNSKSFNIDISSFNTHVCKYVSVFLWGSVSLRHLLIYLRGQFGYAGQII